MGGRGKARGVGVVLAHKRKMPGVLNQLQPEGKAMG